MIKNLILGRGNVMRAILILFSVFFLTGCPNQQVIKPAISDINDSMVKVQARQSGLANSWLAGKWPTEDALHFEALRGCQNYRKAPKLMSSRCVVPSTRIERDCEIIEYLFTCNEVQ